MKENEENTSILLLGTCRIRLNKISVKEPYLKGEFSLLEDIFPLKSDKEYKEQLKTVKEIIPKLLSDKMGLPDFLYEALRKSKDINYLINLAFSTVEGTPEQKQDVLATDDVTERFKNAGE